LVKEALEKEFVELRDQVSSISSGFDESEIGTWKKV
jgi:hypothetical protein